MNEELKKQLYKELEEDLGSCLEELKVSHRMPDMSSFANSWIRAQRMLHPEITDDDEMENKTKDDMKELVTKTMLWKYIEAEQAK